MLFLTFLFPYHVVNAQIYIIITLTNARAKTLEKYRLAISNNYVAYRSKRKSHVTPGRKF